MRAVLKPFLIGIALGTAGFLLFLGLNLWPLVFSGALLYVLMQSGGIRSIKKRFTAYRPVQKLISFSDVGGQSAAKRELVEALKFLGADEKRQQLGIRPLKGILLTGPPGTGKTLLAKASATYTHSLFIAASGSEFIEMYAGVGAQRVREIFGRAKEMARQNGVPSAIIFIDELEVLGGRRGSHTSHLEYDQTLNQLLVEMDGLGQDNDVRILLIGATNRADLLDPALMRPGRFDRIVRVDLPDREGRLQIIKLHTRNKPLSSDVDRDLLAKQTFGFSGAHLESLANEAAILALRENRDCIGMRHFLEAVDKVIMGEKLDRRPSDAELRRVAVHETGHALVAEAVDPGSVSAITISARGGALGYVRQTPEQDLYLYPKEKIEDQIAVSLAGAVAEEIEYGSRSTGSSNDFENAVRHARSIVLGGMSELGIVDPDSVPRAELGNAISGVLRQQEKRVRSFLEQKREVFGSVTDLLMEHERICGENLRRLLQQSADTTVNGEDASGDDRIDPVDLNLNPQMSFQSAAKPSKPNRRGLRSPKAGYRKPQRRAFRIPQALL